MSITTFVGLLFMLAVALIAGTGIALLLDHWRTRKLHQIVRAYEGLVDGEWLSPPALRRMRREDEEETPAGS